MLICVYGVLSTKQVVILPARKDNVCSQRLQEDLCIESRLKSEFYFPSDAGSSYHMGATCGNYKEVCSDVISSLKFYLTPNIRATTEQQQRLTFSISVG